MRTFVPIVAMLAAVAVYAQTSTNRDIADLVKKLGSSSFRERQEATELLKQCPEAEPHLRKKLISASPEERKRLEEILDYFERAPVRALEAAVAAGRADLFVQRLSAWNAGKNERDAWEALRKFSRTLAGLHEKKGGRKTKLSVDRFDDWLPAIVIADRITELTPHKDQRTPYLRVGELDLDVFRRKAGDRANTNSFESDSVAIVAARTARISGVDTPNVILAGQSVHITKGSGIGGTLILSGGAVTLDCDAEGCLIIAKDKVTCNHRLIECRIVSGKQIYTEMEPRDSVLSENELNPLGFIHWSDAPKEKPK